MSSLSTINSFGECLQTQCCNIFFNRWQYISNFLQCICNLCFPLSRKNMYYNVSYFIWCGVLNTLYCALWVRQNWSTAAVPFDHICKIIYGSLYPSLRRYIAYVLDRLKITDIHLELYCTYNNIIYYKIQRIPEYYL